MRFISVLRFFFCIFFSCLTSDGHDDDLDDTNTTGEPTGSQANHRKVDRDDRYLQIVLRKLEVMAQGARYMADTCHEPKIIQISKYILIYS
ncbi:uncharacterized protein LOC119561890 isoform X2 [Drosophila subpulchrella]|uniref:uncharacterized protein LOC119561890 isoform X2 n=1 Tax=Drosophila subpulchrella TaxID=1486046 RepID=UPI0018A18C79|nr:uncharacterized protein LOC119561890 isoform X2 [Drosophila subpulchrella]